MHPTCAPLLASLVAVTLGGHGDNGADDLHTEDLSTQTIPSSHSATSPLLPNTAASAGSNASWHPRLTGPRDTDFTWKTAYFQPRGVEKVA